MVELEVGGKKFMTINDDNTIIINDAGLMGLDQQVVNSDILPDFVTIKDVTKIEDIR